MCVWRGEGWSLADSWGQSHGAKAHSPSALIPPLACGSFLPSPTWTLSETRTVPLTLCPF